MKKEYIVRGWLNGSDYEENKPASYSVYVMAENETDADTLGDNKLRKQFGNCEVIISELYYRSDKNKQAQEREELNRAYLREQGRIDFNG